MLTERNKLALSGSLALALGLVIGVTVSKDKPARDATHEAIGSALAAGSATEPATADKIDTGAYHQAISEIRAADPTAIDLLSPLVQPGAEVTTGVSIPKGKLTTGTVEYIGPSAGAFVTLGVTHTDRAEATWVEVRARNTSQVSARLIALTSLAP